MFAQEEDEVEEVEESDEEDLPGWLYNPYYPDAYDSDDDSMPPLGSVPGHSPPADLSLINTRVVQIPLRPPTEDEDDDLPPLEPVDTSEDNVEMPDLVPIDPTR